MEESLPPPDAESNIFEQFDVHVTGELSPGDASTIDEYFCRLPPCSGKKRVATRKRGLIGHRRIIHLLPHKGASKIPEEHEILQWLRSGKPRPSEIPQRSPVRTKSPAGPSGSSLLSRLLLCKPDTESELQPASLESNIYEQFNVRHEPGEAGGSPCVGYVCLLSPCHEEKVCVNTYEKWRRHRRKVHTETEEVQCVKLPDTYEIREWVFLNKPRPYEVPVSRRACKKGRLGLVDPDVFAEFDVTGSVEDDEQLRFSCLVHPCKERRVSLQGRKSWRAHRAKQHIFPKYEDGEYTLPSREMIKDWMNAGKPPHYKPVNPQRRVQTKISVDSPSDKTITELHNRELDPTPSNVEIHGNSNSLRTSKSLARLRKFRPSTPPAEIPRESSLRGRRPRNADAAGCSSDTEAAHQKKKKRDSSHSTDRSRSTQSTDSDLPVLDLVVAVLARGEDPSGGLREQFKEKTNPTRDGTPPSDDTDEESDDGTEDVDGSDGVDNQSGDQTVEDPIHDYDSADMEEFGEEPREDSAAPEDVLPSLPYSQPELHDSGAAEMAEVDEDAHEEFEAPNNVLPSQPELKNTKVVGHSSVQPQDLRVTDEQQQNSKMADANEEAPKDSVAPENVLPSLQNSSAEMGEVEVDEPEDSVAPENALTALTYSQPKLWEYSSVQPQDFQGDVHETLPNPTAEMNEVDEVAPENSVAIENVLSSLSCLQQEFGVPGIVEHDNVLPQEFQGDIDYMLPNTQMTEVGEAHEQFIDPSNLNPSVQSDVSEEITLSPLWHLDGDTFQCLPQDFPGENRPNSSKEGIFKYSAEMAEIGEEAPEEIVDVGNLIPSMQSESSEQNALSTLGHYFRDALQFSLDDSPGETDNHRPNSAAEMAEVGEEAPEEFVAPGNFGTGIPLMQSEGNNVPSLEDPNDIQAAPIQESVPLVHMDPVYIIGPNAAGMAEVGKEAPEGFVAPGNFGTGIPLMQSEGTNVPSLEGLIDIQVAPIQESVPLVHMDPAFINEPNAAGLNEVGEEALEEFATPGNLVPLLPSNTPQETGEQLYESSLSTNASSQDPRNILNELIIQEYLRTTELFMNTDMASMNNPAAVVPIAQTTQPQGIEIGSIFMEGSAENSRENQVDPVQELINLMDVERAFETELDLSLIDVHVENPEGFFRPEAVAHSPQPMQQLFSPGNSELSNNFSAVPVPVLQTDPLIDMAFGLDYEVSELSQPDEMSAWLFN